MSSWTLLFPFFLGCIGILQGAINRQIANTIGVTQATLIGNIGTIILCLVFYFAVKSYSSLFPDFFHIRAPFATYKWWFVFPALFGFLIVAGMPFAIAKLGAVKVTVGLISAQMITSVLWDILVEGLSLNVMTLIGIVFAFLSVTFITLAKL
jgi:transporter family-2 protein